MLKRIVSSASFMLAAVSVIDCVAQAPLAPVIYTPPQNRTVRPGTVVTFKVDANGYPPLNYRWRRNGLPYGSPSTNTASLSLLASSFTNNNGNFDVVITNSFGAVTSTVATLVVVTQAVSLNLEPQSQVACSGATVVLNAQAGGAMPIGYQWQFNGAELAGAGAASASTRESAPWRRTPPTR